MQANGISPVLLTAPKTIIQRKSTATPRPRNSLPSLFNSQDTPSLLGLFLWGFNENWWTGSLSKKIHISREESSIHVTVTKSWQNVFFKYEEWSLSEWHENANPSTWKQQGDNETEFHVSRSAERWRAPQQCLGLSEMPYSINFDRDYVKCSQSGAFIFLLSDRLIFLEFTHGCVNWLVCTVVSAQYVLSLDLQTVFPPALKE